MTSKNYILIYYQQIKDGSVTVGKWIERWYEYIVHGLEEKRFTFDQKKAARAIAFIQQYCRHHEGPLAPQLITLEVWQKALISVIFGIMDQDGLRQFREVLVVMGRKNGKTLLDAAMFSQSYPTLRDPMDCSPPGSSVHGISQARILQCVAISFSRGSSRPRDRT